jgi:hypothetical protein
MNTRFGQFCQRWMQRAIASTPITVPAFLLYLKQKQSYERYQAAYHSLEDRIQHRSSHAIIGSVFDGQHPTKMKGMHHAIKTSHTSIEPITQINASCVGAPVIWNKDGSQSELNSLSLEHWPDFLTSLSGKVFVTFGFRKGWAATNPVTFTHAVVYVHDTHGNHAFFGFYKRDKQDVFGLKDSAMMNDSLHRRVLPIYTLHDELTIEGSQAEAIKLFEKMELQAKQRFTGWTMNCYTPIVAAMIQAEPLGFKVPEAYRESLLVTVPMERNFGAGITANATLRRVSEELVSEILIVKPAARKSHS